VAAQEIKKTNAVRAEQPVFYRIGRAPDRYLPENKRAEWCNLRRKFHCIACFIDCLMEELVFTVESDEAGGYVARARLEQGSIVTQGDSLAELKDMIIDAIEGYFFENPALKPRRVRLFFEETFLLNAA
jgi:predicted RNase H-like HicB family nuclease